MNSPGVRTRRSRIAQILIGLTCTHRRMRGVSCGYCKKTCRVECPDCGLSWMFYEGENG